MPVTKFENLSTGDNTLRYPNKSGTFALTDDIGGGGGSSGVYLGVAPAENANSFTTAETWLVSMGAPAGRTYGDIVQYVVDMGPGGNTIKTAVWVGAGGWLNISSPVNEIDQGTLEAAIVTVAGNVTDLATVVSNLTIAPDRYYGHFESDVLMGQDTGPHEAGTYCTYTYAMSGSRVGIVDGNYVGFAYWDELKNTWEDTNVTVMWELLNQFVRGGYMGENHTDPVMWKAWGAPIAGAWVNGSAGMFVFDGNVWRKVGNDHYRGGNYTTVVGPVAGDYTIQGTSGAREIWTYDGVSWSMIAPGGSGEHWRGDYATRGDVLAIGVPVAGDYALVGSVLYTYDGTKWESNEFKLYYWSESSAGNAARWSGKVGNSVSLAKVHNGCTFVDSSVELGKWEGELSGSVGLNGKGTLREAFGIGTVNSSQWYWKSIALGGPVQAGTARYGSSEMIHVGLGWTEATTENGYLTSLPLSLGLKGTWTGLVTAEWVLGAGGIKHGTIKCIVSVVNDVVTVSDLETSQPVGYTGVISGGGQGWVSMSYPAVTVGTYVALSVTLFVTKLN